MKPRSRPLRSLLAALIAGAAAVSAHAQEAPPRVPDARSAPLGGGLFNADELRARCMSAVAADASYCFAYITGVHDSVRAYEQWLNLREFCAPSRVPQGELRHAFIDYLAEHPADRSGEAASVVVVALKSRYPCVSAPAPKE